MKPLPESPPTAEQALTFHRKGLRLIPLCGKNPLIKNWPELHLGEADIRSWSEHGVNWGAITGDPLIVLDTDTESAERWVQERGIHSEVMVRSGRGGLHRWFRKPENMTVIKSKNGLHGVPGLDVKGWHGCIVLPGSVHPDTGMQYGFLPGKELQELGTLPFFDPSWVKEIRVQPYSLRKSPTVCNDIRKHIRDVRAYIRAIPSIQGQNGSRALMRVCHLLVDEGYSYDQMLAELIGWNEVAAFPPWSEKELIHAVSNAIKSKLQTHIMKSPRTIGTRQES